MDSFWNINPQSKKVPKLNAGRNLSLKSKLDLPDKKAETKGLNPSFKNTKMHVPSKINFHELLSLPLEKQIQRQNSLKQSQTFCLKFQPEQQIKRLSSPKVIKLNSKKLVKKIAGVYPQRFDLSSERRSRVRRYSNEVPQVQQLKQASKTMYFKPLGKVQAKENQIFQRNSMQIQRHQHSSQIRQKNEYGNGLKDKLMMLLQIRRQQKTLRQNNRTSSSFGHYGNQNNGKTHCSSFRQGKDHLQMLQRSAYEQRAANSPSSYRNILKNRSKQMFNQNKRLKKSQFGVQIHNPGQLTPWNLIQNAEQF